MRERLFLSRYDEDEYDFSLVFAGSVLGHRFPQVFSFIQYRPDLLRRQLREGGEFSLDEGVVNLRSALNNSLVLENLTAKERSDLFEILDYIDSRLGRNPTGLLPATLRWCLFDHMRVLSPTEGEIVKVSETWLFGLDIVPLERVIEQCGELSIGDKDEYCRVLLLRFFFEVAPARWSDKGEEVLLRLVVYLSQGNSIFPVADTSKISADVYLGIIYYARCGWLDNFEFRWRLEKVTSLLCDSISLRDSWILLSSEYGAGLLDPSELHSYHESFVGTLRTLRKIIRNSMIVKFSTLWREADFSHKWPIEELGDLEFFFGFYFFWMPEDISALQFFVDLHIEAKTSKVVAENCAVIVDRMIIGRAHTNFRWFIQLVTEHPEFVTSLWKAAKSELVSSGYRDRFLRQRVNLKERCAKKDAQFNFDLVFPE